MGRTVGKVSGKARVNIPLLKTAILQNTLLRGQYIVNTGGSKDRFRRVDIDLPGYSPASATQTKGHHGRFDRCGCSTCDHYPVRAGMGRSVVHPGISKCLGSIVARRIRHSLRRASSISGWVFRGEHLSTDALGFRFSMWADRHYTSLCGINWTSGRDAAYSCNVRVHPIR